MSQKFEFRFYLLPARLGLLALLGGCRVGPPYHAPAPPAVTAPNYKESTVNFQDAEGWKVASPQDAMIRGNWWEVFNEPELNALEEQLNINNENLKEYFQNYMAARAVDRRGTRAVLAHGHCSSVLEPVANFRQSAFPRRPIPARTPRFGTLPIDVSWTPDFWGKIRNEVHEAQYAAQVSAADLELEKLTEQSSLAEYLL